MRPTAPRCYLARVTDELDWYEQLPVFDDFNDLVSDRNFHKVPAGWSVLIADIAGSTKAIEEGRYKDVNTIGAACIVAAQNALDRRAFPYLFGGDGATLVLPDAVLPVATTALGNVARIARLSFDLHLRVGVISADTLARDGFTLEIARMRLVGRQSIAMFRGDAIAQAEKALKRRGDGETAHAGPEAGGPNGAASCFEGLSCRWKPVPSLNGRIATLMIHAAGENRNQTLKDVLARLHAITSAATLAGVPIHAQNMSYRGLRELFADEVRMEPRWGRWSFFHRMLEIVAAVLVFRIGLHPLFFSPRAYSSGLGRHCDYRKFDGTIQMVLDLTDEQCREVRAFLEELHRSGRICFGMHESNSALMTCYVHGLDDGQHIHFVDGGEGGYAMAARQVKTQMAQRLSAGRA